MLENLLIGVQTVIVPINLAFILGGVIIGQVVGILPGLGPVVTIAVLLPFMYHLDATPALMALCGIYYGSQFGGAISSILVNAPGTESAVITCLDGYPMAKKGRAGEALATAAMSSFVGGIIATILFIALAQGLSKLIVSFGAPEYLALMIFALICIAGISEGSSKSKVFVSICMGLAVGTVGMDIVTGTPRFNYGSFMLMDGIDFVVVAIGLYAFAEVLKNLRKKDERTEESTIAVQDKVKISFKQMVKFIPLWIRQGIIGFVLGVFPGIGAGTSTPLAYMMERGIDRKNPNWGEGEPKGVAAPECSNNACSIGALVPMLTMGIPGSGTAAIMLSAMMVLGVTPGPTLIKTNPSLFWGLAVSFLVGSLILLVVNLPLVKYCIKIVQLPPTFLFMSVWILAIVGAFSCNNRIFDVSLIFIFSLLSLAMNAAKFPLSPFLIATLLGDMIEKNLNRTAVMCHRNIIEFVSRPYVAVLLVMCVLVLVLPPIIKKISAKKDAKIAQAAGNAAEQ